MGKLARRTRGVVVVGGRRTLLPAVSSSVLVVGSEGKEPKATAEVLIALCLGALAWRCYRVAV